METIGVTQRTCETESEKTSIGNNCKSVWYPLNRPLREIAEMTTFPFAVVFNSYPSSSFTVVDFSNEIPVLIEVLLIGSEKPVTFLKNVAQRLATVSASSMEESK